MRVLALETSGRLGSVALVEAIGRDATVLQERRLPAGQRTARTLLPVVDELLRDQAWPPATLELIATTTGPGSFTGLRIGVVAAKTLAYATAARLVGVHTLATIAAGIDAGPHRLWTVLDAQRQELFVARFDPSQPIAQQADPATEILGVDAWLAQLSPGDVVAGPPLANLIDRLPNGVTAVEPTDWSPTAVSAARLGIALMHEGAAVNPLTLTPRYFRKSAAEEKANI